MKRLLGGVGLSCLFHAVAFGLAFGFIAWKNAHAEHSMDIDLSGSSLLLRPKGPSTPARPAPPPEPWMLSLNGKAAPPSKALPQPVSATPEPEGPACPPPCPENSADWTSAADTSRRPDWVDGLITEDDYPSQLRSAGKEGKVVVDVLIDATGAVKGVELVQGSEGAFNDLVLSRLRASRFRPAYDRDGNAVPCRLRLPVAFQLH